MFERFTPAARQTVVVAQEEARQLRHAYIGTEHLLLGLLSQPGTPSHHVLLRQGLTREQVAEAIVCNLGSDELDAAALKAVGIDLADVREKVEAAFGPGALDAPSCTRGRATSGNRCFTRRAKKVMELALREALALKHNYVGDGHILLGLLRQDDGLAMKVIHDCGVDGAHLRREIKAAINPAGEAS